MHSGSDENFVTLYFPFGFSSQGKYGTTSSATSKSGTAKGRRGKEKATQKGGVRFMLLLCTHTPSSRPLASTKHPLQQCDRADSGSWDSSRNI